MERADLIQLVRATARIAQSRDVVVIGSTALLGSIEALPQELEMSSQVDLFIRDHPELGTSLEAALGAGTMYHDEHGICMRAVGPLTAIAPTGWMDRLVSLDAGDGVFAHCMRPVDLVLAKLVVGRGKDVEFAVAALELQLVDIDALLDIFDTLPVPVAERDRVKRSLAQLGG